MSISLAPCDAKDSAIKPLNSLNGDKGEEKKSGESLTGEEPTTSYGYEPVEFEKYPVEIIQDFKKSYWSF